MCYTYQGALLKRMDIHSFDSFAIHILKVTDCLNWWASVLLTQNIFIADSGASSFKRHMAFSIRWIHRIIFKPTAASSMLVNILRFHVKRHHINCFAPSQYLDPCRFIVNWTFGNQVHCNLNYFSYKEIIWKCSVCLYITDRGQYIYIYTIFCQL